VTAQDFAARHWYSRSWLSALLVPAAGLFGLVALARRWLYLQGLLQSVRLPVPVLVVGNLTAGGTGKTPLVIWIARLLRDAGMSPGIVLRGYSRTGAVERRQPLPVGPDSDPAQAGDEAVLLAERTRCPVWVHSDRVAAARALLDANPACDVLICDDGLQHYRIARDFEIAVEDERGHGNGRLLPAGPLRESPRRGVDVTVVNAPHDAPLPRRQGPVLRMQLVPARLVPVGGSRSENVGSETLRGKRLHAVAGIGNPQRFFATLRDLGLEPVTHAFPDHHPFSSSDLVFPDCDYILMTEKDAVKCRAMGRGNLIALGVDARPDPELARLIMKAIAGGSHDPAQFPGARAP
jgi:tetraacyldisaccharide 4'-kinase